MELLQKSIMIFRKSLLARVAAAILIGCGAGSCFGLADGAAAVPIEAARAFATFSALFSSFLAFMIPLIIAGLVTASIAEIGQGAGKMLFATVAIAYADTVFCGFISYGVGATVFPHFTDAAAQAGAAPFASPAPYFTVKIPPVIDVMSALMLAFVAGMGISGLGCETLRKAAREFGAIVSATIEKAIVPLLPPYIFCIFLDMAWTGQAVAVASSFAMVEAVIFAMHILIILIQYCLAGAYCRRNPFKAIACMMPAYFTALGTSSSAAAIPVSHECALRYGISRETAGLVIPLTATIHMSGSAMKITACAVALSLMRGYGLAFADFAGFVMMLGVIAVASPGVPGGAIMASLGILGSILGFNAADLALMIALYLAMDSFGTACNVIGDGAIAMVVDRMAAKRSAWRKPSAGGAGRGERAT